MYMGFVVLLVALCLSAVAAWYSVAGLMVLFAAAALPVAIMASTLEVAKLVTASWLYNHWKRAPWALKSYLSFAVLVLMFVTSLGIFGFLSKAHLDQAMPVGDIATKLEIIDTKIQSQQDNINSAKTVLRQMDDAVNQALGRGAGAVAGNATAAQQQQAQAAAERNTNQAATLRRNQAKERDAQQAIINKAQDAIQKLREERAPIAGQQRSLEAEVGPIKYVAELIWGEAAKNHFDSAVRFLIITLIFVFDPLAVLLVIAANMTLKWARDDKAEAKRLEEESKRVAPFEEEVRPKAIPDIVNPQITDSVTQVPLNIRAETEVENQQASVTSSGSIGESSVGVSDEPVPKQEAASAKQMIWSESKVHEVASKIQLNLAKKAEQQVDKTARESIIEPLADLPEEEIKQVLMKADDDTLEQVYNRIVEETRIQPPDDGMHKHHGSGTPPGSWIPDKR